MFVDSFQLGDEPEFDGLLELFPLAYHEPYFADFVRDDLTALFAQAGLRTIRAERAYMSKVVVLAKPEALSRSIDGPDRRPSCADVAEVATDRFRQIAGLRDPLSWRLPCAAILSQGCAA